MGHQTGSVLHSRAAVAFACAAIALVGGCSARDRTRPVASPSTLAPVLTSSPPPASAFAPSSTAPISLATSPAPSGASTTTAASTTASSPLVPSTAPSSTPAGGIGGVDFENFTYDLNPDLGSVTVVDGKWSATDAKQRLGPESVDVVQVAKGDIDGDGRAEAAVVLVWSTGGTGHFSDVFVYQWDGTKPVLVARDGVGDRAFDGVHSIAVFDGRLQIDRYGTNGGACCPERVVRRTFTLRANEGRLTETGRARTFAFVLFGLQGSGLTPIHFLPGTDGALISGTVADESQPGEFVARRGQTLRLTVDGEASLDVVQGATVIGSARHGAPLRLTLPVTGTYEIRPVVAPDRTLRDFDAELTID